MFESSHDPTHLCTIKGHLLAHPGYSAISIFRDYTANSLLQCMIKFGGNTYRKLHTQRHICPQLLNWDIMGWRVATWCLGMFSWAPTAQYSSASSSISILALAWNLLELWTLVVLCLIAAIFHVSSHMNLKLLWLAEFMKLFWFTPIVPGTLRWLSTWPLIVPHRSSFDKFFSLSVW